MVQKLEHLTKDHIIIPMNVTLNLPEELILQYQEQAVAEHTSLDNVITKTLTDHVSDSDLALMDRVLEKNSELMTRLS